MMKGCAQAGKNRRRGGFRLTHFHCDRKERFANFRIFPIVPPSGLKQMPDWDRDPTSAAQRESRAD
jgi:hypothetical protein